MYVRWSRKSYSDSGAQLVYTGRAGGSHYSHKGSGSNPQCLPLDPNYFNEVGGSPYWSFILYGAEYQGTNGLVANIHDTDVPCAVCYVPNRKCTCMLVSSLCRSWWCGVACYDSLSMYDHHVGLEDELLTGLDMCVTSCRLSCKLCNSHC